MTDQSPFVKPPMTPLRIFFAILGGLILVAAGGCTLYMGPAGLAYGAWALVLLIGVAPMVVGGLILWLALRWRRGEDSGGSNGERKANG